MVSQYVWVQQDVVVITDAGPLLALVGWRGRGARVHLGALHYVHCLLRIVVQWCSAVSNPHL